MKLEVVKIVSASTPRGWSQVHTFIPEEEKKFQKRGLLLAVFSLEGVGNEEETASIGREVISRLHEEYYGSLEETPFEQLKKAVEVVFREVSPLTKGEIIAGALVNNILYLAVAGKGQAVLSREGNTAVILQGSGGDLVEIASGYLQDGDTFLLGTNKFFEITPKGMIWAALESGSSQQAGEILTPVVLGKEEGLASAVVAQAKEEGKVFSAEKPNGKLERRELIKKIFLKIKQKISEKPLEKPKKSYFTVALILFLILGVSMIFGTKERKKQEKEKKIEAILDQVKAKKEEGEAILTLNPAKSREILKEAEELLKQIKEEKATSPQLEKIRQELETSLSSVLREYQVEAKLFFDLELIKKGAVGGDFSFSGGQLVVLDSLNLAVYAIGVADKKSTILAGGEKITNAAFIATSWPKVFVLGEEGIYQIKNGSLSLVVKKDEDWQAIRDLETFGSNLYLLDKKNIWLYPATETGFGTKKAWLKTEVDFSDAEAMAINGAIWVLKKNGVIEKYLRGNRDNFGIIGLDKAFIGPFNLYTGVEEEHIYILDKGNSRLVILNKNGEYYSQYLNGEIKNTNGLVVSEKEKKIFLLSGSKIYQIELKN